MSNIDPLIQAVLDNFTSQSRSLAEQLVSPSKYVKPRSVVYVEGAGTEDDPLYTDETEYEPVTKRWKQWRTEKGEAHRVQVED